MNHFFSSIQGWASFIFLYREEVEKAKDGAVFVEIGAWKGRSTAYMGVEIENSKKDIQFYTVDTFKGSDEIQHDNDPICKAGKLEEHFRENIKPVKHRVNVHVGDSSTFAAEFENESIDFIFVDGDHTREGVMKDLVAWYPKLKRGCRIGGDDIRWRSVKESVEEFFGCVPNITDNKKHWWMRKV